MESPTEVPTAATRKRETRVFIFLTVVLAPALAVALVGAYGLAFTTEDGGVSWQSLMGHIDNPMGAHHGDMPNLVVEPETIGRAQSHGCIRLTNWDAARLAQMVSGSTKVVLQK